MSSTFLATSVGACFKTFVDHFSCGVHFSEIRILVLAALTLPIQTYWNLLFALVLPLLPLLLLQLSFRTALLESSNGLNMPVSLILVSRAVPRFFHKAIQKRKNVPG